MQKKGVACSNHPRLTGGVAKHPYQNMNDETRHVVAYVARSSYSAFVFEILPISWKAQYADSRTLHRLAYAPCASLAPGEPVEKPAASDAATGYVISLLRFPLVRQTSRARATFSPFIRWALYQNSPHAVLPPRPSPLGPAFTALAPPASLPLPPVSVAVRPDIVHYVWLPVTSRNTRRHSALCLHHTDYFLCASMRPSLWLTNDEMA